MGLTDPFRHSCTKAGSETFKNATPPIRLQSIYLYDVIGRRGLAALRIFASVAANRISHENGEGVTDATPGGRQYTRTEFTSSPGGRLAYSTELLLYFMSHVYCSSDITLLALCRCPLIQTAVQTTVLMCGAPTVTAYTVCTSINT